MKSVNPAVRYIASLATVIGCYLVYQTVVVPFIDGEQSIVPSNRDVAASHADPKADIVALFPPHAWELKPCNVLETEQGKLLYQKHERLDDGRVKIVPLTLVLKQDSPEEQPFVIQAEQGAILKFDKPFSFANGIGKIEEGILNGKVRIYRLSAKLEHDDSIELDTENVQLSPERIFTLSDVAFRFGGSHGRGRNLAIDLFEDSPGAEEHELPVKMLELAHVDYIHVHRAAVRRKDILNPLDSANQGSFRNSAQGDSRRLPPTSENPLESGSIDVTCEGGFQLDVEHNVASFKKKVRVLSDDGANELLCDQLWLYFKQAASPNTQNSSQLQAVSAKKGNPEVSTGLAKEGDTSKGDSNEEQFEIQKIVALGQPAKLFSKEQGSYVEAEHLQMDLDKQRIQLRGRQPVKIQRDGQTIIASELEYLVNEDGSLGNTIAQGPGSISQQQTQIVGPDGELQIDQHGFQCDWQGRLTIMPEDEMKLVKFESRTTVVIDGENRLAGDQISFWLWEIPKESNGEKQKFQIEPHKLIAVGNVFIDSQRLMGKCNDLTALWPSPHRNLNASLRNRKQLDRVPNSKPGRRSLTYVFKPSIYRTGATQEPAEVGELAKYRFQGRSVEIKLKIPSNPTSENSSQFEIAELTASGQVSILQENAAGQSDALEIRGQNLQAINLGQELYRLHINGNQNQMAVAAGRGVRLAGPTISLDQEFNRLWIDGKGEMMLEKEREADTNNPEKTEMYWDGGMVFDGQTFYVEGNVKTKSDRINDEEKTSTIETFSQALNAKLNRMISFKEQNGSTDIKAELEKIVLAGTIKEDAHVFQVVSSSNENPTNLQQMVKILVIHRDVTNNRIGSQEIAVPDATIDSNSGEVNCTGPGIVQGIQVAGERSNVAPGSAIAVSSGNKKKPLEYVQIKFDRSLKGNLNSNEMTLDGNVRTIYSPADNWNVKFDADSRTVEDPGGLRLVCDQMKLFQWKPRTAEKPTVEMIATGNALATGQQFKATSHRISYNQATDGIILQAGARRDAELFYQKPGETREGHLTAETIKYNVGTGAVHIDQYKEIDVNHSSPSPRRNR